MKSFPMFLKTTGRRVVIVGGGEQAAQKLRLISKSDAEILLAAPALNAELSEAVAEGRALTSDAPLQADTFQGTALTFIATGCPGADAAIHAIAKAGGAVVNVVDRPELCDAITPSIVDRDPVVVAIGTEGTAPVLGRAIKTQIETSLPPTIGNWAAHAGRLRDRVAQFVAPEARRAFWAWAFKGAPVVLHRQGKTAEAAAMLDAAIAAGGPPEATGGSVALIGAGPGARDLLTLRAVERLQEADIILYDRLVDPDVLELARRDAERVYVGKTVGACSWPQAKISALIVEEALQGRRVVRLKSGDPSIFGRATEELAAAEAAGLPVEVVPGVTAASAAAAEMRESLTERGKTDTLVLLTGRCRPGDAPPDWSHHVRAGTTLAIYMGVRAADSISRDLMGAGAPAETQVEIAVNVSTAEARYLTSSLAGLSATLAAEGVAGVATMFIRFPKAAAREMAIAAE